MGTINEEQIKSLLSAVNYPGFNRDIVSFGVVHSVSIQDSRIEITLKFTTPNQMIHNQVKEAISRLIQQELPGYQLNFKELFIAHTQRPSVAQQAPDPWADRAPIPGVKSVLAVASGKGGVGKSTVATNLAIALSMENLQVGLMDSDIYGPSVPIMMGVEEDKPGVSEREKLLPIEKFGIRMMSMGFLIERDAALIWRGPIVQKAVTQFLKDVDWGELDVLVIDLPPGTGDAQLTLVQKTPITGAVIVTTPQEVAVIDARRGYHMFKKVNTPVFGIVENMSYYRCKKCGEVAYIFGQGGGSRAAKELGVPFLGEIPIDPEVTETGDKGMPIVVKNPDSEVAQAFRQVAIRIISEGLAKVLEQA